MKLTAAIKLLPTPDQATALQRTLETANAACNTISQSAWQARTFKQFDLHRLCYANTRAAFGLSAQLVVRCIAKVADAYKLDHDRLRTFRPHGAIAYDDRILSWALPDRSVSIWTLDGRQRVPFVCGPRQWELVHTQRGETDLALVNGQWYLFAACEVEEPTPDDATGVVGVDLGIVNLATDSDGETFSGAQVEHVRQRYQRRRDRLQTVGTKWAKRRLKTLSGKQHRFQKDTNHRISKQLVAKAQRTKQAIAVEELTGIGQRARVHGPEQRARHSNWVSAIARLSSLQGGAGRCEACRGGSAQHESHLPCLWTLRQTQPPQPGDILLCLVLPYGSCRL
ncbi:MAG TPA: transposase [Herpetosiphonaceae bacterium]|nr:transposase [Herpetosiphonaceae bacterium]